MRPRHTIPADKLALMQRLYEQGYTYKAITEAIGLDVRETRTVSRRCDELPDKSHGKRRRAGRKTAAPSL